MQRRHFLQTGLTSLASLITLAIPYQTFATEMAQIPQKKALIIVSLADNANQGIVPIKSTLGNGQNPSTNLYWGALYGVKTYFKRAADYSVTKGPDYSALTGALDSIKIIPTHDDTFDITAIAFDGALQNIALKRYYQALLQNAEGYDLVVYIGHNPLMDIRPNFDFKSGQAYIDRAKPVKTVVLACQSRSFFKDSIAKTNGVPYVMTNGNMAPEAYTLDGILKAWMKDEGPETARRNAAQKYAEYQKIPLKNAMWLFKSP